MAFSYDVFISYTHQDLEFTQQPVEMLRTAGLSVWFDVETGTGASPRDIVLGGIRASQHPLVVFTEHWPRRPRTEWELGLFRRPALRNVGYSLSYGRGRPPKRSVPTYMAGNP